MWGKMNSLRGRVRDFVLCVLFLLSRVEVPRPNGWKTNSILFGESICLLLSSTKILNSYTRLPSLKCGKIIFFQVFVCMYRMVFQVQLYGRTNFIEFIINIVLG